MWAKVDDYHFANNGWTIDKHGDEENKPKYPYGLWFGVKSKIAKNHGYFTTAKEAIAKYNELNKYEELVK